MSKFLTGKNLEQAVYDIIWDAKETLLIVSPFIKLDDYFQKLFQKHLNNPHIHIIIVFGKNEENKHRSLSKSDFDFFTKFLNISIIYVPNLHAKYYGNELNGIITSINLYDYSFKNNIEFGVYSENSILTAFSNSPDKQAWQTCINIAEENQAIFIKRPVYEKKLLSSILGKNYIKSDILLDATHEFNKISYRKNQQEPKRITDFPEEIELGGKIDQKRPQREIEEELNHIGYCIRTGEKIPFNLNKPFTTAAYRSWSAWGNWDFPEKYCHKTGKPSNGKTTMRKPIL